MKKIFSVILSLVILFTSMGFTLSSHYCGGKKVKTVLSVVNADVSCGMEEKKGDCTTGEQMNSACCQDEFQKIQMDEESIQPLTGVNFSADFLIVFVGLYIDVFENTITEKDFFNDHSPPPLVKNIPVLVQSFLI